MLPSLLFPSQSFYLLLPLRSSNRTQQTPTSSSFFLSFSHIDRSKLKVKDKQRRDRLKKSNCSHSNCAPHTSVAMSRLSSPSQLFSVNCSTQARPYQPSLSPPFPPQLLCHKSAAPSTTAICASHPPNPPTRPPSCLLDSLLALALSIHQKVTRGHSVCER